MNILIYSEVWDAHAAAVAWALAARGVRSSVRAHSRFPGGSTASLHLSSNVASSSFDESRDEVFDAIWNRRPLPPNLSHLHPADRDFAEKESNHFLASFASLSARNAFQVNDPTAARRAQHKPLQLDVARRLGLQIPDTLISNSPDDIRSFSALHGDSIVHKTLTPRTWLREGGRVSAITQTNLIPAHILENDEMLALCPGVYQPLIRKKHEYRITFMDQRAFVAKHAHKDSSTIDGRFPGAIWSDGTDDLPREFIDRSLALMNELGLVFGCMDVIEAADGSGPVFLEVNEMGQWLYVESYLPAFPMLATFCELLIEKRVQPDFMPIEQSHYSFNAFKATQAYAEANTAYRNSQQAQALQITHEDSTATVQ